MVILSASVVLPVVFVAIEASRLSLVFPDLFRANFIGVLSGRTMITSDRAVLWALVLCVTELEAPVALNERGEVTDVDALMIDIHASDVEHPDADEGSHFDYDVVQIFVSILPEEANADVPILIDDTLHGGVVASYKVEDFILAYILMNAFQNEHWTPALCFLRIQCLNILRPAECFIPLLHIVELYADLVMRYMLDARGCVVRIPEGDALPPGAEHFRVLLGGVVGRDDDSRTRRGGLVGTLGVRWLGGGGGSIAGRGSGLPHLFLDDVPYGCDQIG